MSRILPPSKTQTPVSLTLTFSPATSALSPISDLTRPFCFPSRCQPPLGFSSVVDRLKSQSWFLCTSDPPSNVSSKPALQQNAHLWPLLLLPVSWGKTTLPCNPACRSKVSNLCQAFSASSQGFISPILFFTPSPPPLQTFMAFLKFCI